MDMRTHRCDIRKKENDPMRRALPIFILLLAANPLFAGITDIQFSAPDATVNTGASFIVPVQVTDLTGEGVISYEFTVSYPDADLTYTGFETQNSISSGGTIMDNPSSGTVKIAGIFVSELSGAGDLLYLNFTADQVGSAGLQFSGVIFNTTALTQVSDGTITIEEQDAPPQFNSLPASVSFAEDQSTDLDLSQYLSDADNATSELQTTANVLSGSGLSTTFNGHTVTLQADPDVNGTWDVEFIAEDPTQLQAKDTVEVSVTPVNDPPVIDALADTTIAENESLEYTLSAEDIDGDQLTFTCNEDPAAVSAAMSGNVMTLTPNSGWYGTTSVTVTTSDGELSDNTDFSLTIEPVSRPGDVDNNGKVEAYDAALTSQYSASLDPLPAEDPRPWSDWRLDRADVDNDGSILAYDASLILQHVLGLSSLPTSDNVDPAPETQRNAPAFSYGQSGSKLSIGSSNIRALYGANLVIEYDSAEVTFNGIQKTVTSENYEFQVNDISGNKLHVAMATATPPQTGHIFFAIDFDVKKETSIEIVEILNNDEPNSRTMNLSVPTGIEGNSNLPVTNELQPNFPNPFNPATTIRYSVKQQSPVSLRIYSLHGELIRTLVREHQKSGYYDVSWNGTDQHGRQVASGVYFYRLAIGDEYQQTKRMMLVR